MRSKTPAMTWKDANDLINTCHHHLVIGDITLGEVKEYVEKIRDNMFELQRFDKSPSFILRWNVANLLEKLAKKFLYQ